MPRSRRAGATDQPRTVLRVRTGVKGPWSGSYDARKKKEKPTDEATVQRQQAAQEHDRRKRRWAKMIEEGLGIHVALRQTSSDSRSGPTKGSKLKHDTSMRHTDAKEVPPSIQNVVVRAKMHFRLRASSVWLLGASYERQLFPAYTYTNREPRLVVTMQQHAGADDDEPDDDVVPDAKEPHPAASGDDTVKINITKAQSHMHALVALHQLRAVILAQPQNWWTTADVRDRKHLMRNVSNAYMVNITLSARTQQATNLARFAAEHNRNQLSTYQQNSFPGLTWKIPPAASSHDTAPGKRVVVLFKDGNMNFLGFKSLQDVEDAQRVVNYVRRRGREYTEDAILADVGATVDRAQTITPAYTPLAAPPGA